MSNKEFVDLMTMIGNLDDEYRYKFEFARVNIASLYRILNKFIEDNDIIGDEKCEVLSRIVDLFETHILEVNHDEALKEILESYKTSEVHDKLKKLALEIKNVRYYFDNYKLYLEKYKMRALSNALKHKNGMIKVRQKLGANGLDYMIINDRSVYGVRVKKDDSLDYCYRSDGLNAFVNKVLEGNYKVMYVPEYTSGTLLKIVQIYEYHKLSNKEYLKFLNLFGEVDIRDEKLYRTIEKISDDIYDFKDLFKVLLVEYKKTDQDCIIGLIDKIYHITLNEKHISLDRINKKLEIIAQLFNRYKYIKFKGDVKDRFDSIIDKEFKSLDELILNIGMIKLADVELCYHNNNSLYIINGGYSYGDIKETMTDCEHLGFILDKKGIIKTDDKDKVSKEIVSGTVVICGSELFRSVRNDE